MQNLVLAIQNDRADSADQDSGLREDSARTPKVLPWPHRTEARTARSGTPDSARTPRGSESAALATQNRSAHSAVLDSGLREDSASAGLAP